MKDIRDFLSYDAATGVFVWRRSSGRRAKTGSVAGSRNLLGYRTIGFRGREYLAHRLAWLFVHGEMPAEIDHINGDPSDNRLANLRLATRSASAGNRSRRSSASTWRASRLRAGGFRRIGGNGSKPMSEYLSARLTYEQARADFLSRWAIATGHADIAEAARQHAEQHEKDTRPNDSSPDQR